MTAPRLRLLICLFAVAAACARHREVPPPPPAPPPALPPPPPTAPPALPPAETPPQRRSQGPLTQAERDSILREVAERREAWRARHIENYRIQVAVECFCPWPGNPAILEVRGGVATALYDTTGKSMGKPREPWSLYTVEALFDNLERSARGADVVDVAYDPQYGYPAVMRGDWTVGLPDDWFGVRASRLTPLR